jgi:hypothetical protein
MSFTLAYVHYRRKQGPHPMPCVGYAEALPDGPPASGRPSIQLGRLQGFHQEGFQNSYVQAPPRNRL